jgi:hypothetical protein
METGSHWGRMGMTVMKIRKNYTDLLSQLVERFEAVRKGGRGGKERLKTKRRGDGGYRGSANTTCVQILTGSSQEQYHDSSIFGFLCVKR